MLVGFLGSPQPACSVNPLLKLKNRREFARVLLTAAFFFY